MNEAKKTLIVASGNAHKIREIAEIFTEYEVRSQREAGFLDEVEETGSTFAENALLKARAAVAALGLPVLADDSGLCVPSLNGAPGVRSARYSGEHGNDQANRDLLRKNLRKKTDRAAYFVSSVALVYPDGREYLAEGRAYGYILDEERGQGGFGYDSIFYSDDLQKSFAEASAEEKNAVSHRGRALASLRRLCEGGKA